MNAIPYTLPPSFPPKWAVGCGEDQGQGVFVELPLPKDNLTMEMRWIPPGRFMMGSPEDEKGRLDREGPQHPVTLREGYWLALKPCTLEQWNAVMEDKEVVEDKKDHPATNISWDDCQAFCQKLKHTVLDCEIRLPTEAEWEYACRAGTTTAYNDGSDCTAPEGKDPALEKLGWYHKNSGYQTHPVGKKQPNAWGLYDMHGNVLEWCQDWYANYTAEEQLDPKGPQYWPEPGSTWWQLGGFAWFCRSAYRYFYDPSGRFNYIGFRLAVGQS